MTPTIGRIVHVLVDPITNNGSDVAPAMVTRVWSDACVNLRIMRDGTPDSSEWRTSAYLYDTEDDARAADDEAYRAHKQAFSGLSTATSPHNGMRAFWPPRG